MKGYRFYLEYPNKKEKRLATRKKPGNHLSTVIATFGEPYLKYYTRDNGTPFWEANMECAGALFHHADSVVCGTSATLSYINSQCKRISEEQAREIHPKLFEYLEAG